MGYNNLLLSCVTKVFRKTYIVPKNYLQKLNDMRINKYLIVLLFPLISLIVASCCDCIDPIIEHYTNKTITVKNIDNSGMLPEVTNANSVPKEAFGIRVQLNREKTAYLNSFKLFFIQPAYATSCDCPPLNQFEARDSVITIQVFTLNNFDINHDANADVSAYFKVFEKSTFSTLTEFITDYNTLLYDDNKLDLTFDMLLMTPPSLTTNHSFKVKITLSDGRIIEGTTNTIELK